MSSLRRTSLATAAVVLAVASMTGCHDWRADRSIKKTQEILARMQDNLNGENHAKDDLARIREQLDRANQERSGGNASGALQTASGALSQAEQTLINVLSAEANAQFQKAEDEMRVGEINGASSRDPQRYALIRELKQKLDEQRAKSDHEDVIETARLIIREMGTLLDPLVTQAKGAQSEAENALQTLKAEGGTLKAAEVVIQVEDILSSARKILDEQREYLAAKNKFEEATGTAKNGVILVKSIKSKEELAIIENLLGTAVVEGATQYVPAEYEQVAKLLEDLNSNFANEQYDRVLQGANITKPKAENLVEITKRAAADARIKTIEDNIKDLVAGGTKEYLPGRVEELEAILAKAKDTRQADNIPAFDEIKKVSVEAGEIRERIIRDFDTLAAEALKQASDQLETTAAVNAKAETVFRPVSGDLTQDQQVFEAQKSTRQQELTQDVENARKALTDAFQQRTAEQFRAAILAARDVESRATQILSEIYHVVGHNAAIELANLISRYERDGAREYAPEELKRSQEDLASVKGAIAEKRYRESVQIAASSRANVELMAQRIAGRATVNLKDAREALATAGSDRTKKYRSEMLESVRKMIEEAEGDLAASRLKSAVEKADGATQLARRAAREAAQQASSENIESAQRLLTRAQDAGAGLYAGREVEDAKNLLSSSQALFAGGDFDRAENVSRSAIERSQQALLKKILDAETALSSANAVGGWNLDSNTLGSAGAKIREARQAMESNNYALSSQLALEAKADAAAVADRAKNSNFDKAVDRISRNLGQGTAQGINFFQPEDSREIRRRLTELQNSYSIENYDRTMAEVAKLEGRLRGVLEGTGKTVEEVAMQQESRLKVLEEGGARSFANDTVDLAEDALKYARLDYRRGLFKSAHSNLNRAIKLVSEIELRQAKEGYNKSVDSIIDRFQAAQQGFDQVLRLDASQVRELALSSGAARAVAISTKMTPTQFREEMERLYTETTALKSPAGYEEVHELFVTAINDGRLSALRFEQLGALNSLTTVQVNNTVGEAYARINNANDIINLVQRRLFADETRFRAEPTQVGLAGR